MREVRPSTCRWWQVGRRKGGDRLGRGVVRPRGMRVKDLKMETCCQARAIVKYVHGGVGGRHRWCGLGDG